MAPLMSMLADHLAHWMYCLVFSRLFKHSVLARKHDWFECLLQSGNHRRQVSLQVRSRAHSLLPFFQIRHLLLQRHTFKSEKITEVALTKQNNYIVSSGPKKPDFKMIINFYYLFIQCIKTKCLYSIKQTVIQSQLNNVVFVVFLRFCNQTLKIIGIQHVKLK